VNIATAKVEELIDLLKEQFTIIIVTHNHYLLLANYSNQNLGEHLIMGQWR
jgi:hypothetical protein